MASERHLILDNNGFYLKDERFSYQDVEGLYFYYEQTQKTLNFVASGIDHNVVIKVFLKTRSKPLEICTGPQYVTFHGFGFGKSSSESAIVKFNEVAHCTFNQRTEKHIRSMQENGYFIYDGKKFHSNGDVVSDKWRANIITDKPWLKYPFFIALQLKPATYWFGAKLYEIGTTMDTDVFLRSLKIFIMWNGSDKTAKYGGRYCNHAFGLTWRSTGARLQCGFIFQISVPRPVGSTLDNDHGNTLYTRIRPDIQVRRDVRRHHGRGCRH